jgi:hypothetical protein
VKFKCPLCGSALTERHYHEVVKVQAQKEKVQKGELDKLRKATAAAEASARQARKRQQELQAKAKKDVEEAKKQVKDSERKKQEIRHRRLMSRIRKLEEEKKMLQKHTSPQEIGLADEGVLVRRLRKEFPEDRIEHAGKSGDVLQHVKLNDADAGCIVYECKHTDRISGDHVIQTCEAKKSRQASYAILVTTGTRKGFSGLDQESGIFVVAQAGVLTLARICRDSLIAMAKQRLDAAAREAAAKRLMNYITSPICRTPLEEAIAHTTRAHKVLVKEIRQHVGDWKTRHLIYQTISYDVSHIQTNIDRVLAGKAPLLLEKPVLVPLALPAS